MASYDAASNICRALALGGVRRRAGEMLGTRTRPTLNPQNGPARLYERSTLTQKVPGKSCFDLCRALVLNDPAAGVLLVLAREKGVSVVGSGGGADDEEGEEMDVSILVSSDVPEGKGQGRARCRCAMSKQSAIGRNVSSGLKR
jgi:hypothetical protein